MTEARNDLWHVQMASGDVLVMTLDELDEAFQSDRIDESTMVLQGGSLKWAPLGEVLGGDDAESEAPSTEPAPPPVHVPSVVPAPLSVAPVPSPVSSYPSTVPTPMESMVPSVRPMAYDLGSTTALDDDFGDELALKPSKKKVVFLGLAAAAVIAGLGFGVTKMAGAASLDPAAANASLANIAAAAPAPPPQTQAANDSTTSVDSLPGSRLSDDQKAMLAKMDNKLAADQAAKQQAAAEKAAKKHKHGKFKPGKSGFHDGGDKMDPLNGHLN
ncbi:MAG TPA: hypothetical protein VF407_08825 [Polyangiaceae bacterium]